jgi:hypothetical protein
VNVAPATMFEAVIDTGDPGIAATVTVEANDNLGGVTVPASSTGITEIAPGVYTATRTSPATQGQYTLIWRHAGDVLGIEDLTVTYSAPADPTPGPPVTAYAAVDELARILQLTNPSVPPPSRSTLTLPCRRRYRLPTPHWSSR